LKQDVAEGQVYRKITLPTEIKHLISAIVQQAQEQKLAFTLLKIFQCSRMEA
jgi:hypothetical protein